MHAAYLEAITKLIIIMNLELATLYRLIKVDVRRWHLNGSGVDRYSDNDYLLLNMLSCVGAN